MLNSSLPTYYRNNADSLLNIVHILQHFTKTLPTHWLHTTETLPSRVLPMQTETLSTHCRLITVTSPTHYRSIPDEHLRHCRHTAYNASFTSAKHQTTVRSCFRLTIGQLSADRLFCRIRLFSPYRVIITKRYTSFTHSFYCFLFLGYCKGH